MTTTMILKQKLTPGFAFRLSHDPDAENDRLDAPVARIICWHRRYQIGDQHDFAGPDTFKESLADDEITRSLYLLDHSGLALRLEPFGDRWDSGQVGHIVATPQQLRAVGVDPSDEEAVNALFRTEIELEQKYLNGEYYRIMIHRRLDDGIIESPLEVIPVGTCYEDEDLDEYVQEWVDSTVDGDADERKAVSGAPWTV